MPSRDPRDSDPAPAALLAAAEAAFTALTTYTLTLHSHPENGEPVALRYSFRKPGFIRMDFIRPHAGATLIFDPRTRTARVWPFGFPRFPSLALDPGNPMIRGPQGHRIDQSDLGTLVRNLRALREGGAASVANVGDPGCLVVEGASGRTVAGVHRYRVWFDAAGSLPNRVISEDNRGERIESVTMDDLRIDAGLPEDFFGA
ncbi:membrane protein [Caballeronia choica]|jgi:outer membrane lipoprotein-sorting protein|uniref:Membrane protein n=1 Tax=Caballeronia choica TaxID=326476 RepID=A0A158K0G3_9BURK|nr:hypothetical protein [Caballeronia choica]SAL74642.1 membrane protein [Caballeronia choica]